MSHFLAIAVLPTKRAPRSAQELADLLQGDVTVASIQGAPIGFATAASTERIVVGLTKGGVSTDLLGHGHRRSSRVDIGRTFMERAFDRYGGIAVMVHFFRGRIETEAVDAKKSETISLYEFLQLYPGLEEDVRYVITWRGNRPTHHQ